MTDANENRGFVPPWAWVPMVMCAIIGFLNPGLWFVLIGLAGAAGCALIARKSEWRQNNRITLCVAVVALSWMATGGLIGGSAVLEQTSASRIDLSDEATRREIFAKAMQAKPRVDRAEEELLDAIRSGKSVSFYEKSLEMAKSAAASRRESAQLIYRLTPDEMETIINEGTADEWPIE